MSKTKRDWMVILAIMGMLLALPLAANWVFWFDLTQENPFMMIIVTGFALAVAIFGESVLRKAFG